MNKKKRKIIKDGVLDLAGFKLLCYNLEDGTRVLSNRGMQIVLKIVDEADNSKEQQPGNRLWQILNQKAVKPFIDKEKKLEKNPDYFEPIVCYKGGQKINGYEATTLVDICKIFLEVRKDARMKGYNLSPSLETAASQSEILLGSFAKTGIIALIDEATGYQYEREKFTLQKIFRLLVLEDGIFSEAKKMFPLDYYKELFEVYDVDFTAENIKRKPRFIGWLTSELVYKNLPKGSFVLEKIKSRTPKTKGGHYGKRFYRSLTPAGEKALIERINTVKTLAWVSKKSKNKKNKLHELVKERFHPDRDLPYIDIEAMDDDKKKQSEEMKKFNKALEAISKVPKIKDE